MNEKPKHPRPSPNYISSELLVLIGKIAVQSVYVDFLIGELLGGLTDSAPSADRSMIHARDTRGKTEDAEKLIKSSLTDSPDRAPLLELVKQAADLLSDRNLVLHGLISYRGKELKEPIYLAFRGKHKGKEVPFTKDTLVPIMNDLDDLSSKLMEELTKRGYISLVS
jgi:hypothetical protein